MNTSRRNLLTASALGPLALATGGMAGGALLSCSSTGGIQVDPAVLDAVMSAVAEGCNFIPAVETMVGLITTTFPALVGATTIAESVLTEIKDILCANIPTPTPAPATKMLKLKSGSTLAVAAHGWIIGPDGKLEYV